MKVKKYVYGAISTLAVVLLSSVAVVSAHTEDEGAAGVGSNGTGNGSGRGIGRPTTGGPGAISDEQKAEITARLEQRKAEFKTRLTAFQQRRIETRCKNAQTILNKRVEAITTIQTNRQTMNTTLTERLSKLEAKLSAADLDTTQLKEAIATLQTKVDAFKTDMSAYLEAAKDTAELDCTADPTAFKASLEASRTALKKVRTDAMEIRKHVKDTIKPQLVELKAQLQSTGGAN